MLVESLCCVLEQDTIRCLELVQPRKIRPNMTEKLLNYTTIIILIELLISNAEIALFM